MPSISRITWMLGFRGRSGRSAERALWKSRKKVECILSCLRINMISEEMEGRMIESC